MRHLTCALLICTITLLLPQAGNARAIRTDVGGNWGKGVNLGASGYNTLYGQTGYAVKFTPLAGVTDIGDDTGADSNGSLGLLQSEITYGAIFSSVYFDPAQSEIINWYQSPATLTGGVPSPGGTVIGQLVEMNVSYSEALGSADSLQITTDSNTYGGSIGLTDFDLNLANHPYELTSIEEIQFNYPDGRSSCANGAQLWLNDPYSPTGNLWFSANDSSAVPSGVTSCNNTFLFGTYQDFISSDGAKGYIAPIGGLPWGWKECAYTGCEASSSVPEPGAFELLAAGLLGMGLVARRRSASARSS